MHARSPLLTGATGFVGGAVRAVLAANGWGVRCSTRDAARARNQTRELERVEGDVGDPASRNDRCWQLIEQPRRLTFNEAAARLSVERDAHSTGQVAGPWGAIERMRLRAESPA
jgi:nucleoside-diphosphate-sugar epimerase